MKRLIIVRHAKSAWDSPVKDYNRHLTAEGIQRAEVHAKLLKERIDFVPELWLSSFANRALHTAVIFADTFNNLQHLKIKKALYTFNSENLIAEIKNLPDEVDSVILFSHNEACHETVEDLSAQNIPHFKTASAAFIEFSQDQWSSVSAGKLNFIISKEEFH